MIIGHLDILLFCAMFIEFFFIQPPALPVFLTDL